MQKITLLNKTLPMYSILQLLFSLLGALYMLWFIFKIKKGKDLETKNKCDGLLAHNICSGWF